MTYTALSPSGPRMTRESDGSHRLGRFTSHHRLAAPLSLWEQLKIGAGAPPVLIRHGWLIIYHGVSQTVSPTNDRPALCYSAGVMVLSSEHPRVIRYRSGEPLLKPELPQERRGAVANVVFPTGIDRRDDLDSPERFDVYYGMADDQIGVARLDLPGFLAEGQGPDSLLVPKETGGGIGTGNANELEARAASRTT
jgi:predicted GH43/DUF377 family glycosyl hydrolase